MDKNKSTLIETVRIISGLSDEQLNEFMDNEVELKENITISGLMLIATGLRMYAESIKDNDMDSPDTYEKLLRMAEAYDNLLFIAVKKFYEELNKEVG